MKNLSDFKKRLKVGVMVHTIYHMKGSGRNEKGEIIYTDEDRGVRPLSKVQSTQFAFKNSRGEDSWCKIPKASEMKILDQDTVQILEPDYRVREGEQPLIPILTFKFIYGVW